MGPFALFFAWLLGTPLHAAEVQRVQAAPDRVIVRFDGAVTGARAILVAAPNRIAIDVPGVDPGGSSAAGGPVSAIRQGGREGGTRIVLDLARPAIVAGSRFAADGRTLTLDLRPVDDARFAAAARGRALAFAAPAGTAAHPGGHSVSMPVPPARPVPLPRITGGDDSRPLVVIDAGHGGHDPGAISPHDGTREKDVTLAIARAVRDRLAEGGRVRVALTREGDRFLVLRERYALARRMGAALFISIHADSAENREASGATAYTLSEIASDKEAARLAARENKADILAGVNLGGESGDVSSILIDLAQRETMNASAGFARLLGREATGNVPTRANFHRMASLMVLKAPDMPSILFESGYLSNEDDVQRLTSRDGRRAIADSIARAVEIHFARRLAAR